MMSLTHAAFSTTTVALALCTADPVLLIVGAIASQLPDLDTPDSYIGRVLRPLSDFVSRWGHRQITHSLLGTAIAWVVLLPLLIFSAEVYWSASIGYLSGWLLDACSKTGVPILYPNPRRGVFPLDPNFRLKTGSITERLFCGLMSIALVFTCYLNLNGGILTGFSNWLGSAPGAVDIYYQYADSKEIFATVTGVHRITQEAFDKQRFRVLAAATETDLVVADKQHKYRVGASQEAQIRPTKIVLDFGKTITIETQSIGIPEVRSLSSLSDVLGDNTFATGQLETEDGDILVRDSQKIIDPLFTLEITGIAHSYSSNFLK